MNEQNEESESENERESEKTPNSPMKRVAKLKLDNPWEIRYLQRKVLKNWRDESLYQALIVDAERRPEDTARILSWEFLRRNLEYINVYFNIRYYRRIISSTNLEKDSIKDREDAYYGIAQDLSNIFLFGIRFSDKKSPKANKPPKFLDEREIRTKYPYFNVEDRYIRRKDDKLFHRMLISLATDIAENPLYSNKAKKKLAQSLGRGIEYSYIAINPTVTVEFSLVHDLTTQVDSASNWLRKLQAQYKPGATNPSHYAIPEASRAKPIPSISFDLCIRYLRLLDALFSMDDERTITGYRKKAQLAAIDQEFFPNNKNTSTRNKNISMALKMSQDRHYLQLLGLGHLIDTPKIGYE